MHNTHSSKNPGLCSVSLTSVPLTLQNPLSYLWVSLQNIKDCFISRTKAFKQDLLQTKLLSSSGIYLTYLNFSLYIHPEMFTYT